MSVQYATNRNHSQSSAFFDLNSNSRIQLEGGPRGVVGYHVVFTNNKRKSRCRLERGCSKGPEFDSQREHGPIFFFSPLGVARRRKPPEMGDSPPLSDRPTRESALTQLLAGFASKKTTVDQTKSRGCEAALALARSARSPPPSRQPARSHNFALFAPTAKQYELNPTQTNKSKNKKKERKKERPRREKKRTTANPRSWPSQNPIGCAAACAADSAAAVNVRCRRRWHRAPATSTTAQVSVLVCSLQRHRAECCVQLALAAAYSGLGGSWLVARGWWLVVVAVVGGWVVVAGGCWWLWLVAVAGWLWL